MNQEPATQTLADLYASHQGKVSDKWTVYLKVYEELFRSYRASRLRLLEIGIQNGGSLEIWGLYFGNASVLVGCDINVACTQLRYDDPRIHVVVGDANTDEAERAIAVHSEGFDLIIDDGSHRSSDIIRSFARYFPRLEQGGIFVVEDLHCSYWQEFEGGLVDPWSSMSFLKRLADVINHEHWGTPYHRAEILRSFESRYGTALDEESLAQIHSIEFYNSVCVIRKRAQADNELGPRVVAGKDAITAAEVLLAQRGAHAVPEAQNANGWSVLPPLPEDELLELRSQKNNLLQVQAEWRGEVERLHAGMGMKDQQLHQAQQESQQAQQQLQRIQQDSQQAQQQLHQAGQELQQTQQQLKNTQTRVEERDGQLAALENELRAIRASTSWRLTSPMRKLAHFLRRR
ncbi:class I SAM-dependent methyltransferase [Variovorax paradoxus]|nr:class I SAM-dependent methyltransferase [Variovorax paradoxus]